MVVTISGAAEARLRAFAEAAYPDEGCGVMIGAVGDASVAIGAVTPGRNLISDRSHDRYLLDPADIVGAERSARTRGLDIVGFWHTHPDHPAWPSQLDADHAWAGYVYVICGVTAGVCEVINAFTLPREGTAFEPADLAAHAATSAYPQAAI